MRATRLSKLWLKALRTDSNTLGTVPFSVTKLVGQTANLAEYRDTDDLTILHGIDANGAVFSNGGATVTKIATVGISAADIVATGAGKLGHANGQILIAAPGAGFVIELVSAVLSYTFGVAAYTAGGNLTVNISGGGAALTGLVSAANSLGAAASKVAQFAPLSAAANLLTANTGLNLVSSVAFTQPGTATGTAKVIITYRVHAL